MIPRISPWRGTGGERAEAENYLRRKEYKPMIAGMNGNKVFLPICVTLTAPLLSRLDDAARSEDRSRSAMARVLISEGLTQRGPESLAREPERKRRRENAHG